VLGDTWCNWGRRVGAITTDRPVAELGDPHLVLSRLRDATCGKPGDEGAVDPGRPWRADHGHPQEPLPTAPAARGAPALRRSGHQRERGLAHERVLAGCAVTLP